jgi:hypothetical protein
LASSLGISSTLTTGAFAAMVTHSTINVSGSQGQGTSITGVPVTNQFNINTADNGKMGTGGAGGGSMSTTTAFNSGTTANILNGINNSGVNAVSGVVTGGAVGNNRITTANTANTGLGGLGGGGGGSVRRTGTVIASNVLGGAGAPGAQGGGGGGGGGAAQAVMNTAGVMTVTGGAGGVGGAGYVRITWF